MQERRPVAYHSLERLAAAASDASSNAAYRERMISATVEKHTETEELDDWDSEAPTLQSGCERRSPPCTSPLASPCESSNDVDALSTHTESAEGGSDWIRWHRVTVGRSGVESEPCSSTDEPLPRSAVLEIEFELETQFYTDLAQDPFDVGIFIPTYRALRVGTLLSLCFELPGGVKITAPGEVRWVRGSRNDCRPGLGVAITFLSDAARSAIAQFCSEHTALYVEV